MIETERLILRPQTPADRAALHAMWADPLVMADLGPVKSATDSDAAIARHLGYGDVGLGFWAVERRDSGETIGFCGLKPGAEKTPIEGEVEIGWMIARAHWRLGYALEAAAASIDWVWANRDAPRVMAITAASNLPSQALMRRLGMRHLAELDFRHPAFPDDDHRRQSVVFAIDRLA
ncbi:GNAT family N-acetyltransferase [Sphingomonas sp. GB1N7]|uniref:GNAT family N-acetyltransferase n=1 Tax=Parasphingomonas caseinilytica TaxID=3096158 RepID=UPI002FCBA090